MYHLQECTPSGNYDLSRRRHDTARPACLPARRHATVRRRPSVRGRNPCSRCVKYVRCPLERTTPGGAKRARGKEFNSGRYYGASRRFCGGPDDVRGTDGASSISPFDRRVPFANLTTLSYPLPSQRCSTDRLILD